MKLKKELISYLFFGVCTTAVNYLVFFLLKQSIDYRLANAAAWLASVIFAYITNKVWVFESHCSNFQGILREFITFTGSRILSGLFDMGFLILAVEWMHLHEWLAKLADGVIVVILNYIFSKLLVFRKGARS